ncbi:MAG TPA: dihydrofolate reductase family protein [Stackebrandtia sp.]|jgi:dihydrofolate reductase|uniref:dihydrofolate reductase family protein n=1 Tax=Stackebrandtia sp. TaxID=2023065 RepID=UPI002D70F378|nr:dihydrofolate reductase family protein [Stackebrandtia sp.]HZE37913.1 dihydrofolate reductase family protein [Stackebrandtia sp.]
MRKLVVTQNISLDGSIEFLGDWFSPQGQTEIDQSDLIAEIHRQDSQADGLLVGRQTFEDFRGYWPTLTDDTSGISAYLNQVDKYVVSSTLTEPGWENTTVVNGEVAAEVDALKRLSGKDIVLTGSIRLCHAVIAAGLVDEYRLFTYPAVQGRGRRLFPEGLEVPRLRLEEVKGFTSGVTLARYATV